MQAVYALSTDAKTTASADYTLTKIVEVLGVIDDVVINDADFSFLLFVQHTCTMFSQYGELVCMFLDSQANTRPSLAFLPGNKIELAHQDSFAVWHLTCGLLLAAVNPQQGKAGARGIILFRAVAADQAGSKLAFCSAAEPFLHVYNSATVEELYCLEAAGNIKLVNNSLRSDMVWTVYGWLLVDTMNREK